jgi:hypothetical protein
MRFGMFLIGLALISIASVLWLTDSGAMIGPIEVDGMPTRWLSSAVDPVRVRLSIAFTALGIAIAIFAFIAKPR